VLLPFSLKNFLGQLLLNYISVFLKMSQFWLQIWKIFFVDWQFWWVFLLLMLAFSTLKTLPSFYRKSVIIPIVLLNMMCLLSLAAFKIFSKPLAFSNLTMMYLDVVFVLNCFNLWVDTSPNLGRVQPLFIEIYVFFPVPLSLLTSLNYMLC
jgi:hypothetical protein